MYNTSVVLLCANGKLSRYVSVLTPPIPQWVPSVAGGEIPTQLKSAKKLNHAKPHQNFIRYKSFNISFHGFAIYHLLFYVFTTASSPAPRIYGNLDS